jgi:ParB-like chromosome segregation protein Spo0J
MELALVENLQRKDPNSFEESEALHQLAHRCSCSHEDMARKLGKSRTSITESLSLANMPDEVRNLCRLADITSKSTLLQRSSGRPAEDDCARREAGRSGGSNARGAARREEGKPGRRQRRSTCAWASRNRSGDGRDAAMSPEELIRCARASHHDEVSSRFSAEGTAVDVGRPT